MCAAKATAARDKDKDFSDDDEGAIKQAKKEGKPLPPTFPPHPKIPPMAELDEREALLVRQITEFRENMRNSPAFVEPEKKGNYIERYTDKYDPPAQKLPLYRYVETCIDLFPEELVPPKAKRKWKQSKRVMESNAGDIDVSEEDEEESGEERSAEGDEDDIVNMDDEPDADEEGDYAYNQFSDDEGFDDDDGGDRDVIAP